MYNWKPLSYESYCDAELGSVPLSKHKDYLYLVVAKRDWTVSNKETTYDPSLKGPTVVPGRDRASCRLTDARKVPNLKHGPRSLAYLQAVAILIVKA